MRELSERLRCIDHWKNDPYELIRYYKEFKGNVAKVERMYLHMIKWRRENDIDSFLERYRRPDPIFDFLPLGVLEGTDREGFPIYVDRMGAADSYGMLKEVKADGMVDYLIYVNETINSRSFWKDYEEREGHRVANMTVLIDLGGLNAGHLRPGLLPLLQRISRITQDCYSGWGRVRAATQWLFLEFAN